MTPLPRPPSRKKQPGETEADGEAAEGVDVTGAWVVQGGAEVREDGTFVGYRVDEVLAGINNAAVGRTADVTGEVTIDGDAVTTGTFTADLTTLESDEDRRDNRLRTDGLQTDQFPQATFALTAPIDLGDTPVAGEPIDVAATGDLTLHGTTQAVTVNLQTQLNTDGTITVIGQIPILFADYGITKPDVAGFVTTEDNGLIELRLELAKT